MLDGIEALIMLEKYGTVTEAAVRLRLTQSAVSKRIQALQQAVGFQLVEADGRRIRLTSQAIGLLERAHPLVAELRSLTSPVESGSIASFSLALADSIAASWGPAVVRRALQGLAGVTVDLHAHRSVLLIESVRLGRYHLGLCTDDPGASKDLVHFPIVEEPMVLLHSGFAARPQKDAPLITIEPGSATWRAIRPLIRHHHPSMLDRHIIPVESFSAAVQMVKSGFGDGLVPLGLAMELGVDRAGFHRLSRVKRGVSLLARKTITHLTSFSLLHDRLAQGAQAYFAKGAATAAMPA